MPRRGPRVPPREPTSAEPREGYTALGVVLRPHGLKGEVRVFAFAEGAPNLQVGRRATIGEQEYRVVTARPDKEAWVLRLSGVGSREDAEAIRGGLMEAPDEDVERDDEESYFIHELVGIEVFTEAGERLGRITEVLQPGANDVYVVSGDRGEVLIPAIGEVVRAVDVGARVMRITPLPGLLDNPQ